jgi:hypothetical protein
MHHKVQKTRFFDINKVKILIKKRLTLSKNNQKSPFKQFLFGRSKSSVKSGSRILCLDTILRTEAEN